ncbi:unnamed protein product [Brassica oleracea]
MLITFQYFDSFRINILNVIVYPPIRHNSEFTCRSDAALKKELNSGGVAWSFYNSSAIVGDSSFSEIHGILSDIRLLSTSFVSISFRFIYRENLKFEDSMAKQALSRFVVNPV